MRIIIAGAGEVGFHLARLLEQESQDIYIIDTEQDRLDYVDNYLDVFAIRGSATSFKTLQEAGVHKAHLFISVTSRQNTNITAAMVAKKMGARKTIARISELEFLVDKHILDLKDMGIDELISPESLASKEITRLLKHPAATDTFDFSGGKLSLVGINLDTHAAILGKTLIETAQMNPERNFLTVAIQRKGEAIIPRGHTKLEYGDHAYFIVTPDGFKSLFEFTGKKDEPVRDIIILGGSSTGQHAAKKLSSQKYNVKLIEHNREKAFDLADDLEDVLVINGDGTEVKLLEDEGIQRTDAFLALTGNSETNIISCLLASNHGAKKTIAMVENIDYIGLSQNIGLDTLINKKLIAANFIFRYLRKGNVLSIASIHGVDAEILEFEVTEKSRIIKKSLKDLKFPKYAIVGGLIRGNEGFITMGDAKFKPGDRVVVFTLPHSIHQVEQFFK